MKLSMNATTTFYGNVINDIRIAKEAGFDGIELQSPKLFRYLDAGLPLEGLLPHLEGIEVSGVGALHEDQPEVFAAAAHRLSQITQTLGSHHLQMCTGPVDVQVVKDFRAGTLRPDDPRYVGAVGRPDDEALALTARNVAAAADIAAEYGLDLYLEPLGWAPVNSLRQGLQILETIDRPNAGLTIDFWHAYVAGDTPEWLSRLDPTLIKAVHVCDALPLPTPRPIPDQDVYRDVATGGGVAPLQEWVDAAKRTGFDGWYCTEIFCRKVAELDFLEVARTMRGQLAILVA